MEDLAGVTVMHGKAVAVIAANMRRLYDRKEAFRIYHSSTNCTCQSKVRQGQMIDTSKLNNVLSVNSDTKTTLVEPNVPMDKLVEATFQYGFVPPVVMEFPGITVGGGFSGTSGESSSFRRGYFECTINQVEVILANGETVNASKDHLPDLFHGAIFIWNFRRYNLTRSSVDGSKDAC
jgi:delta24-sterol reductase